MDVGGVSHNYSSDISSQQQSNNYGGEQQHQSDNYHDDAVAQLGQLQEQIGAVMKGFKGGAKGKGYNNYGGKGKGYLLSAANIRPQAVQCWLIEGRKGGAHPIPAHLTHPSSPHITHPSSHPS